MESSQARDRTMSTCIVSRFLATGPAIGCCQVRHLSVLEPFYSIWFLKWASFTLNLLSNWVSVKPWTHNFIKLLTFPIRTAFDACFSSSSWASTPLRERLSGVPLGHVRVGPWTAPYLRWPQRLFTRLIFNACLLICLLSCFFQVESNSKMMVIEDSSDSLRQSWLSNQTKQQKLPNLIRVFPWPWLGGGVESISAWRSYRRWTIVHHPPQ